MSNTVAILLSTFNGGEFLPAQLDSIINQTYTDWVLFLRDDGSTDNTLELINTYTTKEPKRIKLLHDNLGNLGARNSYAQLLKKSNNCDYIAFSDQDDVWESTKLEKLIERIKRIEIDKGKECPVLVHCDMSITDEKLNNLDNSFYSFTGLKPQYAIDNTIICRNVIPGCSMLMNAALVKSAGEIPEEAVMHDYWLVLFARYTGVISFVDEPLLKYRQHGRNTLGAKSVSALSWKSIFRNFIWYLKGAEFYNERFKPYILQAEAFCKRFNETDKRIEPVRAFTLLKPGESRLRRKKAILFNRLKSGSFRENLELLLCG